MTTNEARQLRRKLFIMKHAAAHAVIELRKEAEVLKKSATVNGTWPPESAPLFRRYRELMDVAELLESTISL